MQLRRHPLHRGCGAEVDVHAELVGGAVDEVAVEAQHLAGAVGGVQDRTSQDLRSHRMQLELKLGHDAEIAATTTDCPEEVTVAGLGGADALAASQDEIRCCQVVAYEAKSSAQPAEPAAQCQPGYAGVGHDPRWRA